MPKEEQEVSGAEDLYPASPTTMSNFDHACDQY
jgi:hypothetical protein